MAPAANPPSAVHTAPEMIWFLTMIVLVICDDGMPIFWRGLSPVVEYGIDKSILPLGQTVFILLEMDLSDHLPGLFRHNSIESIGFYPIEKMLPSVFSTICERTSICFSNGRSGSGETSVSPISLACAIQPATSCFHCSDTSLTALMLALLDIVQGVISTIMQAAGFGQPQSAVLPSEIVSAIEDCGFFESIC